MSSEIKRLLPDRPMRRPGPGLAAVRAIIALVLREMGTRYGRSPGGYLWALLQPLGIIIVLSFAWSLLMKTPTLGTSFLLFKATAVLILQMYMGLGNMVGRSMMFSRNLLFYPRITWMDAVLARFLLNGFVAWVVAAIILSGIMVYDEIRTVLDWNKISLAVLMVTLLGLGTGCLNCFLFQRFPIWQNIWNILTAPMFLISGVIFIYEDLPPLAQEILWYNPVLHLTGLMRDGFYPTYSPGYISLPFVWVCILIPMVTGLLLLRQFHRDLLNR